MDGGSSDASRELAAPLVDRLINSEPGRARQMNCGAAAATGSILLFLHVDTLLPPDALAQVLSLAQSKSRWGRFDIRLSGSARALRLIEFMVNLRSRITKVATGDQAIFVTASEFAAVGGFPSQPLMEDVALSKILRQRSACLCLRQKLVTSSRRWESKGIVKTVLLMWWLRLLYVLGVSPAKLHSYYTGKTSVNE